MHPRVAKLYLEFVILAPALTSLDAGRHVGTRAGIGVKTKQMGLAYSLSSTSTYRAMVQEGFMAEPHVTPGTPEFARRLARGRWALRQLKDLITVRKYRAMTKRYDWSSHKSSYELVELFGENKAQEIMMGFGNKDVFGYNETLDLNNESPAKPKKERLCLTIWGTAQSPTPKNKSNNSNNNNNSKLYVSTFTNNNYHN
ncbi:hypothetical protein LSM04_000205 [Trypanosoma melophagium]|uniref:uncharacterized protein n=1 Tax=Trypanosoma melophagium TaxID=715481 RepID=UPI00351A38EC|nr:hypothetical protein LSM04_000205 [Trypanosoma melophagium]